MPSRKSQDDQPGEFRPTAAWKRTLRRRLLAWFVRHARELPWRGTRDPYRIWVSEIMLQQTRVGAVVPYYERFLARFGDIETLAAAPRSAVLRQWEGLGYYRRAVSLHEAARIIVNQYDGALPREPDQLAALPGIGRYTAGAILSIAHDARLPIVEANSARVLCRLAGLRGPASESPTRRELWRLAEELLPSRNVGTFNQALMELGSEVCTAASPRCDECPLAAACSARSLGEQDRIPLRRGKPKSTDVRQAAVVVWREGNVLLRRCQPGERWAGLWDFPRFDIAVDGDSATNGTKSNGASRGNTKLSRQIAQGVSRLTGVRVRVGRRLTTLEHTVTRFRITLDCHEARCIGDGTANGDGAANGKGAAAAKCDGPSADPTSDLRWVSPRSLSRYPLSVTGRRIARLLQK
jgi:A/G-specific adenine glycosylase